MKVEITDTRVWITTIVVGLVQYCSRILDHRRYRDDLGTAGGEEGGCDAFWFGRTSTWTNVDWG